MTLFQLDGTMPVDRFAQVNLWQQLMASMARVPGALQQYDLGKDLRVYRAFRRVEERE